MVMAETQKSPESVRSAKRLRAQRIRQDSAACVSLSSNHLSKSAEAASQAIGAAVAVPSRRKRGPSPGEPGSLASKPVIAAHCRAPVHGTRAALTNTNALALSTPRLKYSRELQPGRFDLPSVCALFRPARPACRLRPRCIYDRCSELASPNFGIF